MTTIEEAVKSTKRAAQQFRHLLQVGEYLENVGSLEQAGREAQQALDALNEETKGAKKDLVDARRALNTVVSQREDLEAECDKILGQADNDAAGVVNEAKRWAGEHRSIAELEATALRKSMEQEEVEHASFMKARQKEEHALTDRLDALRQEIADIKARL